MASVKIRFPISCSLFPDVAVPFVHVISLDSFERNQYEPKRD